MKAIRAKRQGAKVRVAAKNATAIHRGLKKSIDVKVIVEDFLNSQPSMAITAIEARAWARHNVAFTNSDLKQALTKLYSQGYVFGQDVAAQELAKVLIVKASPSLKDLKRANAIDWANWKAGNRAAARLLDPPHGLRVLMRSRNVTLQALSATTTDRIGTHLAYGLAHGLAPRQVTGGIIDILSPLRAGIAKELGASIEKMMSDPERALMIAQTEMSRAVSVANRESYKEIGVELVEWLVSDPCDLCAENGDASPLPIDDEFPSGDTEPPVHPNCMCDIAPYIVDTQNIGEDALSIIFGEE